MQPVAGIDRSKSNRFIQSDRRQVRELSHHVDGDGALTGQPAEGIVQQPITDALPLAI